jgi:N,N'-diacetyllegionaminate synthase
MTVTIIAELGSNHDGSLGQAMALAKAAIDAGCTYAKFQDHRWQVHKATSSHPPWMQPYAPEGRIAYLERTCFTGEQWGALSKFVRGLGAKFMVSPFSVQALEWHLEHGTLDAIKIASGMVTNRPLLEAAKNSGLPIYLSTGMSTNDERADAYSLAQGGGPVIEMACVSEYPCRPEHFPLSQLTWQRRMVLREIGPVDIRYGYSDHCLGNAASLAAITLGATAVERHVGWSRQAYGSDAAHSLTMEEFASFVVQVRELERMLAGKSKDEIVAGLGETRKAFLHKEQA